MDSAQQKAEGDKDCVHDKTDSMSCNPELIKQMEGYLIYIAIGVRNMGATFRPLFGHFFSNRWLTLGHVLAQAFIAAALQLVRLMAGKAIRSKTTGNDRFP